MPRSFVLYNVKKGRKVIASFWTKDDAMEYKNKKGDVKITEVKGKILDDLDEKKGVNRG